MDSTVLAFVLAVLAVPGVTSILTSAIRALSDGLGIGPEVIVYVASVALTGVILATGAVDLPPWAGDPVAYVGAWLAWATANAELARRVYELIRERVPVTA